jgi:hypothetical protein
VRNQFPIISPIHFYIKEKHEFLQLKLTCNIFFVTLKSTIARRNDTKINLPIQTSENLHWIYQLVICMKNINQFCTKDLNIITSSDMFKQFRLCQDKFRHVKTVQTVSRQVQTCLNSSDCVKTNLS